MGASLKYQNKIIAVYGMGLTGFSAARALKKVGAKVFCWDDDIKIRRKIKKKNFSLDKFWKNPNYIDQIVISPGIDLNKCKIKSYLTKNLNKIITDLDLFFDFNKKCLIISVTGTNGKSTTCKVIEKILKTAKYNVKTVGNIGKPILSLKQTEKKSIIILEVSSYQLQYSNLFRSKHAAILNISPDHLERHKYMNNYIKIKSKIFFAQKKSDYSYINTNNKYSKSIANIFRTKKLKSQLVKIDKYKHNLLIKKINNNYFKSAGNTENMTFAYKIAKNLKIKDKIIIKSLNKFKGLPHRQEIVFENKKLLCINDSKATSFDASFQSLSNFNNIYWIVGGMPKHQDRFYLKKVKVRIKKAYIIGKNVSFFKKQIKKNLIFSISNNLKNAINHIYKDLKLDNDSKPTILFSPAAASFDQFSNFENRGNYFKNLITKKFKKNT
jgi:UDP-N-acetylmuramoylalanine--D-glutamate ligase